MALQSLIRWVLPRETHFFDFLEGLGRLSCEAAEAFSSFQTGRSADEVRAAVQLVEHEADNLVRQMEDALARTFVTPLDREDLHHLSNELDDIIDLTNLAARTCGLYGVKEPTQPMIDLMAVLVRACELIREAVPNLRVHQYEALIGLGRRIRVIEKEGDEIFRGAMSELFSDPKIDAKELIRQKEVLDHIEHAIDSCDNVGDILANLAVKHG
jgi:predicted phosphate transport protein (TIGR00153 family)